METVSFQKANSRKCWPLIRDTCVPSHLIEAGFPEKETTLEQYDKTNRFKDITTVFVIGTFFMVHWNCFLWGIFLFEKVIVQHGMVNVFLSISSFLLDIILSWRAHHDDRFPNLPKFDYRSAKTSNNAVAGMSLTVTSQNPSLFFCFVLV